MTVKKWSSQWKQFMQLLQASLSNCINCFHCDDHFFTVISFPQFIYDLFHISLTIEFKSFNFDLTLEHKVACMLCCRIRNNRYPRIIIFFRGSNVMKWTWSLQPKRTCKRFRLSGQARIFNFSGSFSIANRLFILLQDHVHFRILIRSSTEYDSFFYISKNVSVTDSVSFLFLGLSCCRCNCINQKLTRLEPEGSSEPHQVSW